MIITDIKKQVKDTERYSIYIDNKFVFGLSGVDVLYYRLKIGNEITQEKYDELYAQLKDGTIKVGNDQTAEDATGVPTEVVKVELIK